MSRIQMTFAARPALRAQVTQARNALSPATRIAAAEALGHRLTTVLPAWLNGGYLAGYWAVRGELSLHGLFGQGWAAGNYCLPCLEDDGLLRFAPWRPGDPLRPNRFGIPEPELATGQRLPASVITVVLVPLLAFDRHGNRLGQGGGYYDRSFAFLRGSPRPTSPLLIGIGYALQEVEAIEPEPWDVALDYVATEREIFRCAAKD